MTKFPEIVTGLFVFHVCSYDLNNDMISIDALFKRKTFANDFAGSRKVRFDAVDLSNFGGVVSMSPVSGVGSFVSTGSDWFDASLASYPAIDYDAIADSMIVALLNGEGKQMAGTCDRWYGVYQNAGGVFVDSLIDGESLWDLLLVWLGSYIEENVGRRKSDIETFVDKARSHFDASSRFGSFGHWNGVYRLPSHDDLRMYLYELSSEFSIE